MAQQFNLTAQINLQSPKNVGRVVSDIQRQLKGSGLNTVNIKVKADPRSIAQTNRQLQNVGKNSRGAAKDINSLNRSLQEATRRFSVITLATGSLLSFVSGFKNATKAAIEFERELLKISQVTGKSVQQLQGLTKEVTRLSTAFGVSSADLLNVSRTLAQAGFNAEKTRKALDILAKTTLAATFDNIQDTTEGAIALLRQFGAEAKRSGGDVAFLEKSLDAINAVSKKFAVESGDLITVIRRVGGVFSAAGGSINELIALFTSVRATTRESAETIATGLRTIFTRIQRTDTIQQLKALNIELQDSQGRFVGAFEAVRRLSQGLSALDPRDFRFSEIVESLGGFRQIGKVIPLIQQFATAQQALTVAQNASGSTAKDAAIAQQGLGNQIAKVREEFTALIRKFSDSGPFNSIATGALKIASAMIKVAEAVEPLLPLLTTMFGLKLGRALAPGLGQLAGIGRGSRGGGGFSRFARGGMVPGSGNRDTVPAMLTPGEFVIKKSSVKSLGPSTLAAMNQNRLNHGGKPERIVAHAGGATHFTHLDKIRSVPTAFRSKMAKKGVGNIDRLYSNLGLDLPAAWNSDWSRGKDNHGVFVTQLIDYVRKNKSNSIYEETAGGKFKRGIFGTITGKARSGKLSSAYTPSDPKAASLLNDSKITNSVVKNFTAGLGAIRGKFLDTDPDVIRAGVGDILLQSLKKEDERLAATFKEISTFKTKDGGRTGIKGGEERSAASTAARRKTQFPKRKALGGLIQKFAKGGAATDTIPALLTPGEFVFNKSAAKSIGHATLSRMNKQGVQGFAKGGPVGFANGGPVEGGGFADLNDLVKYAEDEAEARKKNIAEMTKNTAEEKKNTSESTKGTQGLKNYTGTLSKAKEKLNQFASRVQGGAASLSRVAQSAQSFVFLGASIGAVTAQMSGLEDSTKKAINETTAFIGGVVGIGATVIETFSSIVSSTILQTAASNINTEATLKEAAAKGINTQQLNQGSEGMGKFAAGLGGVAAGVGIVLTAAVYYGAKQRAVADELAAGVNEALKKIGEGAGANADELTQATKEEIEARKRSAAVSGTQGLAIIGGVAAAAGTTAATFAAFGTALGPPGIALAGFAGALVGGGLALFGVKTAAEKLIHAKQEELAAINASITGIINLRSGIYDLQNALGTIDSAAGLSDEVRLDKRIAATAGVGSLSASSIETQNRQARKQLESLTAGTGKTFQGLSEKDFEDNEDAAEKFKFATELMAESVKAAEVRFKATSETFQLAMQTADPSKTFAELSTQAGPYKSALDAQIASIKVMTGIQIQAAEQQLRALNATEGNEKAIEEQDKKLQSLKDSQDALIKNTREGAEAAQKVAHAQYEAARRTREASIALARSLVESGQFFDGLNKQLQSLQGEALAIDNFNAALDGAVFKFKEINIDEIDNLTNVKDLSTFAKQLGDAAKGAGPEAQKYVDQLTANAAAFKKAQEGGLLGLKRDPISDEAGDAQTKKILNDLGFSAANLGVAGEEIFAEMQSKLTEALKDGVIDPSEFQSIIGEAEKANGVAVDAAKKLAELRQQELTNLQANLAAQEKLRQEEIKVREAQVDAIRKGVQRTEKAQEILAKSINPDAEFTPQRGVETRLQNINAQNRLDTLGMGLRAGDIGGVTRTRRNAQQRQEEIRKEIKAGGLTIEQTKALAEEQAKLAKIINTTEDELKRLADRSSEAADIQSAMEQNLRAIEKERRAREQVTGVIEDFVVGGVEARRGLVEAATGVRQAFATGTLQMQTPEQRQATVGLLDRLSDTKLLGGMTGREIKQELVFRDAVRLGLDPELATAIALGTSTEEKLIDANRDLAKKMEQLAVSMLLASQGLGNPFAAALATGGMVQYRAGGGSIFKPRGTDTVPAMLSPGEFVIRKSAVDSIGADTLAAINEGGVAYRDEGSKDKEKKYRRGQGRVNKKDNTLRSVDIAGNTRFGTRVRQLSAEEAYNKNLQQQADDPRSQYAGGVLGDPLIEGAVALSLDQARQAVNAPKRGANNIEALIEGSTEGLIPATEPIPLLDSNFIYFGEGSLTTGGAEALNRTRNLDQEALNRQQATVDEFLSDVATTSDVWTMYDPEKNPETIKRREKIAQDSIDLDRAMRQGYKPSDAKGLTPTEYMDRQAQIRKRDRASQDLMIGARSKLFNSFTMQMIRSGKVDLDPNQKDSAISEFQNKMGDIVGTGSLADIGPDIISEEYQKALEFMNKRYADRAKTSLDSAGPTPSFKTEEGEKFKNNIKGALGRAGSFLSKVGSTLKASFEAGRAAEFGKELEAYQEKYAGDLFEKSFNDLEDAEFVGRGGSQGGFGIPDKISLSSKTISKDLSGLNTNEAKKAESVAVQAEKDAKEILNTAGKQQKQQKVKERDDISKEGQAAVDSFFEKHPLAQEDPETGKLLKLNKNKRQDVDLTYLKKEGLINPTTSANDVAMMGAAAYKEWKEEIDYNLRTGSGYLPDGTYNDVPPSPKVDVQTQMENLGTEEFPVGSFATPPAETPSRVRSVYEGLEDNIYAQSVRGTGLQSIEGEKAKKEAQLAENRAEYEKRKEAGNTAATRGRKRREQKREELEAAKTATQKAKVITDQQREQKILKARYERILRTQGPAAAQRFANYSGYEPPASRFTRRRRSQQSGASNTDQLLQQLLQQMLRQGGGNRGGITPRGIQYNAAGGSAGSADVIPAMLTPGEFVMSAGAVRQHGVGAMRSLNKGQIPRFNRGGMVGGVAYRTLGSPNAEVGSRGAFTMDTEGLEVFQQSFDKTVQTITADLKDVSGKLGHFEMSHTFSGEVGLNVTGVNIDPKIIADQFSAAFTEMVKTEITQAFANRSNNLQTPGEGS